MYKRVPELINWVSESWISL